MIRNKLSYKSKVHLFFGGGLLLALSITVAMSLVSGQDFFSAMIGALSQIRPVEFLMYFAFWYWLARGQEVSARPAFTSLNLRDSKT
ncbi:MAG TPA: hypothetical protein VIT88_08535 [Pyrinomonadaceae bacterium]